MSLLKREICDGGLGLEPHSGFLSDTERSRSCLWLNPGSLSGCSADISVSTLRRSALIGCHMNVKMIVLGVCSLMLHGNTFRSLLSVRASVVNIRRGDMDSLHTVHSGLKVNMSKITSTNQDKSRILIWL